MENIRDWCISRQLWWGHRIPVWYCDDCGAQIAGARRTRPPAPTAAAQASSQDPDVLDTWFSSGLWPFSTLGWPDETEDLRYFYPTTVLETGYDILFFWVARMIMLGLEMTGDIPFDDVYLHGLIRDEHGQQDEQVAGQRRLDPLDVIEEYGADALRFTLLTGSTPGNDMKLSPAEAWRRARNFANKIWNAARFVLSNLGEELATAAPASQLGPGPTLTPGRPLDPEPPQPPDRRRDPPDRRLPVRRGRAADLRVPVGRVLRLVHRDRARCRLYGDGSRQAAERTAPGAGVRAGADAAPAAPVHALRHRGDLAAPAARRRGADRRPLAAGRPRWTRAAESRDGRRSWRSCAPSATRAPSTTWSRASRSKRSSPPATRPTLLEAQRGAAGQPGARGRRARLSIAGAPAGASREQALTLVIGGVEVYLPLAGLVDLDAERARLAKEIKETGGAIDRSESLLSKPGLPRQGPRPGGRSRGRAPRRAPAAPGEAPGPPPGAGRVERSWRSVHLVRFPTPSVLARWCPGGKIA